MLSGVGGGLTPGSTAAYAQLATVLCLQSCLAVYIFLLGTDSDRVMGWLTTVALVNEALGTASLLYSQLADDPTRPQQWALLLSLGLYFGIIRAVWDEGEKYLENLFFTRIAIVQYDLLMAFH